MKYVRLLEERALFEASNQKAGDVELLHSEAAQQYEVGDDQERAMIARAIVVSLGGLRVATNGRLIFGTGKDVTRQRKWKKGEAPL